MIENRCFEEIAVGDHASLVRTITQHDIELFAAVSGDVNPAHVDPEYAESTPFKHVIAHGMLGGALISSVLGTALPGPGTIYLGQDLRFKRPVSIGDTITVTVSVVHKDEARKRIRLACACVNQDGQEVISGMAEVVAPSEKVRRPRVQFSDAHVDPCRGHRALLADLAKGEPVATVVVHPCDTHALAAAIEAAAEGLIRPILVGPQARIRDTARRAGLQIGAFEIVDAAHSHAAADIAVGMVRSGQAQLLMKGSLHTDELMRAVVDKTAGLRTERRISHVYLLDVPAYPRPILLTDSAINIAPGIAEKCDIVQNAIDLAHILGIAVPKVALLAAVETVSLQLRSTIDAAALCKMADRGQITGGVLDGPLAFDNAINSEAARDKGIASAVAGNADILVVPDLESGNMLGKQLIFLAGATAAGIVLGARVPIILTSRSDCERTRIASCALAVLVTRHGQRSSQLTETGGIPA